MNSKVEARVMKDSRLRWLPLLLGGLLSTLAGCGSTVPGDGVATDGGNSKSGLARLQTLDEQHAVAFRAAFDAAKDHDRYVVALSPT